MRINIIAAKFIIKRAFRHGLTTRNDVIEALEVSTATASRYMRAAETLYSSIVERNRGGIQPRPLATPPEFASEAAFLDDLDSGKSDPLKTGLFDRELPVIYVAWTNSMPPKPGVLAMIAKAIQRDRMLQITYIGLKFGSLPMKRLVLPLALERMNDQWRVIAQDMNQKETPIRTFVLSRILDAEPYLGRKPRNFVHQGPTDSTTEVEIALNPRLNEIQKETISRELRIKNGKARVAARSLHEFCRRFAETPVSADAVWPPIIIKGGR